MDRDAPADQGGQVDWLLDDLVRRVGQVTNRRTGEHIRVNPRADALSGWG